MNNFINVRFPRLNKNCDLTENDNEIGVASIVNKCRVMKRIDVHDAVYRCMGNELMDDVNEVLYENIGGSRSDDPRLDGIENFMTILNNHELRAIFEETMYTMVVEVNNIDTGAAFYVNTEGYAYARYVGRAMGPA